MVIDITQLALTVGLFVGQALLNKGTDKVLDEILERVMEIFRRKFSKETDLIREFEKDPRDEKRKTALIDSLAKKIGTDDDFRRQIETIVRDLLQSGWTAPTVPPPVMPHQLPTDIDDFTGREAEVACLLEEAKKERIAAAILVVTGMGGTGKSALAVHVAHLLKKDRFPDLQLYVDLRGAGPQPASPLDVLASFLLALGCEESDIPRELEDRAALYRSSLADRKALVLLDNARDETQVQPLLPGSPGCLALVTSRWSLAGLEGVACRQELGSMGKGDALALLAQCAGHERVFADARSARRIVRLCGSLPLAIHISARQLRTQAVSLHEYASRLETEKDRLEILRLPDREVRASLMLSYSCLSPWEARLFRRLGLLQGATFSPAAALALDGGAQKHVWKVLERLVDAQLIGVMGTRYRIHDLVHLLARECLNEEEAQESCAARLRLARWLADESQEMGEWLQPVKRTSKSKALAEKDPRVDGTGTHEFFNALGWFEMERGNLLAAVQFAYQCGEWALTWQLAVHAAPFYNLRGHWSDWEQTHVLALDAARRAPDEDAQGSVLNLLGNVYRLQGRWELAASMFEQSLALNRKLDNSTGESIALNLFANLYRLQGRWDQALAMFEQGLELNTRCHNDYGSAIAMGGLGNVYRLQGRWEQALQAYEASLAIAKAHHDRRGRSINLNNKGWVFARQGRLEEAEQVLQESLALCRGVSRKGECIARRTLGEVRMRQGRWEEAFEHLSFSLEAARKQKDKRCTCQALDSLGEWYTAQGHWEQAEKCLQEERSILRSMDDRHDDGLALRSLGRLRSVQEQDEQAACLWQEALEKLNNTSPEYEEVKRWLQTSRGGVPA